MAAVPNARPAAAQPKVVMVKTVANRNAILPAALRSPKPMGTLKAPQAAAQPKVVIVKTVANRNTILPAALRSPKPMETQATLSRPNALLEQLQTTGASALTAQQDKLSSGGVAASRTMAQTDLARMEKFRPDLQGAGATFGLPTAVLAGIASRESRAGNTLNAQGKAKFDPTGYGLMQIDRNAHPELAKYKPFSREHIYAAAKLVSDNLREIQQKFPHWPATQQLKGAIAAYNMGIGPKGVNTIEHMDDGGPGDDYSADVWARAQYYAGQGY